MQLLTGYAFRLGAILILILSLSSQAIEPKNLLGFGSGSTEILARQNAFQDLASQIEIEVKSTVIAKQNFSEGQGRESYSASIQAELATSIDLPLLGVSVNVSGNNKDGYRAQATLNSVSSLPIYLSRIEELSKKLRQGLDKVRSVYETSNEEPFLLTLQSDQLQLEKYRKVTQALGIEVQIDWQAQLGALQARLLAISERIDSLDKAAEALSKDISVSSIYVYPPSAPGSAEVTNFAALICDTLRSKLKVVNDPEKADYVYRGHYTFVDDGLFLNYALSKKDGQVVQTSIARVLPQAYRGIQIEPQTSDIETLIQQGFVRSGDFRIEATSSLGKRDLLFRAGQEIELLIKMNRPGYFYAVEHISMASHSVSLLLELEPDAINKRRFVGYVNADDVNKWISIGKFVVKSPFGIERLQFIASAQDLVDKLPEAKWREEDGNFVIGNSIADNIAQVQTRGLGNQRRQNNPSQNAGPRAVEYFLTFTTMKD